MGAISNFMGMGGYAGFVWPAFAVTAAVLVTLWVVSLRRLRDRQAKLARLEAARPGRRRGRADAEAAAAPPAEADGPA